MFSPAFLVDPTSRKETWANLHKAINNASYRGDILQLTEQQTASLSMCEVPDKSDINFVFQFTRMAIPASLESQCAQAAVVTRAKILPDGSRENSELLAGHCGCKAGIAGRDIHCITLLFLTNNLKNLEIPSDKVCCTGFLCQWVIPSSGPTADLTVPMEMQEISGKQNLDQETGLRKKKPPPAVGRGADVAAVVMSEFNPTEDEVLKYMNFKVDNLSKMRIKKVKLKTDTDDVYYPTATEAEFNYYVTLGL